MEEKKVTDVGRPMQAARGVCDCQVESNTPEALQSMIREE